MYWRRELTQDENVHPIWNVSVHKYKKKKYLGRNMFCMYMYVHVHAHEMFIFNSKSQKCYLCVAFCEIFH